MRGEGKADSQNEELLKVKRNLVLVSGSCSAQTVGGCILQWHSLDSCCLAQILISFSAPCLSSGFLPSQYPIPQLISRLSPGLHGNEKEEHSRQQAAVEVGAGVEVGRHLR